MITKYHLIVFLLNRGVSEVDATAIADRIHDATDCAGGRPFEVGVLKYIAQLQRFATHLDNFVVFNHIKPVCEEADTHRGVEPA
jgi:hypothetical protein